MKIHSGHMLNGKFVCMLADMIDTLQCFGDRLSTLKGSLVEFGPDMTPAVFLNIGLISSTVQLTLETQRLLTSILMTLEQRNLEAKEESCKGMTTSPDATSED